MDRAERRAVAALRDLLGALMTNKEPIEIEQPSLIDVVALLADFPRTHLSRGQVGTVVELLDEENVLVEFSGDDGRAHAIAPIPRADLLVLHYVPEAAA
jgi:hypothetical protein